MQKIFEALCTKISGSAFDTAITGFYYGEAPLKVPFPYSVFRMVGSPSEYTYDLKNRELTFSITIHSKTKLSQESHDLYDDLVAILDESSFAITGWDLIDCAENNAVLVKHKDEWIYDCTYVIYVEKDSGLVKEVLSENVLWDLIGI